MSQEMLLWGVGLPALVCAVVLLITFRPWRGGGGTAWAGANALAAGLAAGYLVMRDWQVAVPPRQAWEWLAYIMIALAIAIGYGVTVDNRGKKAWTTWVLVAGLSAYLIVDTRVDQFWAWRIVTAVMMLASMTALDRLQRQSGTVVFPIVLGLAALASCLVLVNSRNDSPAQMAGALAACLGVAALLAWWRPAVELGSGGVLMVGLLLPGLAMSGYFAGSKIPAWCFVLAAAAPAAYWLTEIPVAQRYVARQPMVFRIGTILVAAGTAAGTALVLS